MTPTKPLQLHVRLLPGVDDDLRAWWAELDGLPFGAKAQAIKAVLRRGLSTEPSGNRSSATPAALPDLSAWLPEIRRALAAELDQRQWTPGSRSPAAAPDEPEMVADLLAQLDASLTLADETELAEE